jgi:hypothetical protein
MASASRHKVPWIFWPLAALWDFLAFILNFTGRLIGIVFGFVLMVVGILLTLTVVGAVIGVPLIILSILLMVRSLF